MLSRAFTVKPRWNPNPKEGDNFSCKLGSILEYSEDCLIGFVDDLPLIFCNNNNNNNNKEFQLSLREILRASVSLMGESKSGMTVKAVLLQGKIYAVKRFRKVSIGRREFGRRVEKLAQISQECDYLVPITAFLYSRRIKFVLCDYYPMGSLADLLSGARELGHTALDWNQRFTIALDIARAISFIHTKCPSFKCNMPMNVHGNIKASNVMIKSNFAACLSDYGFAHLAEFEEFSDTLEDHKSPRSPSPLLDGNNFCSQKSDIYNFGIILLDILGGAKATGLVHCIMEKKEEIKKGEIEFFEVSLDGKERSQALKVLDIALACANQSLEARPSMKKIVKILEKLF